jgi:DNA helicase-2/ATP-dependent DNA helicase PcrA
MQSAWAKKRPAGGCSSEIAPQLIPPAVFSHLMAGATAHLPACKPTGRQARVPPRCPSPDCSIRRILIRYGLRGSGFANPDASFSDTGAHPPAPRQPTIFNLRKGASLSLDLQKTLNPEQYRAAAILDGPLLIIAGAGSGKTRTVTYRIANMLESGIPQSAILALTFTNKAAKEMSYRVREITGRRLTNLTVSTFHAFGVQVLRRSINRLGYKPNFSIYDQTDKISLLKEVAREMNISRDSVDFYGLNNLFSAIKTGRSEWTRETNNLEPMYREYLEHLYVYNAVDFDDLIMLPIKIFEEHPEVLAEYRSRYRYLMVDEFQDTSQAQYRLMKLLGEESRNVCVVGDDDQSIYSWRGANYHNIVNFERDFPERIEIKLEQNYRSTRHILDAANTLISNNTNRKLKKLWTGIEGGKALELYHPDDETKEAEFISEMIKSLVMREGYRYHDFGILVRTNSLTTAIENCLLTENIPYRVSGGQSFFQRKEVKDITSYMRVLANPDDDVNLLRVVNTPRRGIGKTTLQKIREVAEHKGISLYSAISALRWASDSPVSSRAKEHLEEFISLVEYYRQQILTGKEMANTIRSLVERIDYWGHLLQEHASNDRAARWKYKNIGIFLDLFERWEKDPDTIDPDLFSYLNRISLTTRDDDAESEEGKVNLMTIHASKGLEFTIVFLAGVEENLIPHARAVEENEENLEEERRLFYVAITRARQKLYMTSCTSRRVMRERVESSPSPFLDEIPDELIEIHTPEEEVDAREAVDYFAKMKERIGGIGGA